VDKGQIHFESRQYGTLEITNTSESRLRNIRGKEISLLFQETHASLNPSLKVGIQISRAMRWHQHLGKSEAREKTLDLIQKLNFEKPELIFNSLPYELSGGMAQRINLGLAIANEPILLIADECTSSLDQKNETHIISLLKEHVSKTGSSLIFISHDLNLMKEITGDILFMDQGRFSSSTKNGQNQSESLKIKSGGKNEVGPILTGIQEDNGKEYWIRIQDLSKEFQLSKDFWNYQSGKITALKKISFRVEKGNSLGVYGPSGSGKSTLGRIILGLIQPSSGSVQLNGYDPDDLRGKQNKSFRKDHQVVFQDVTLSLNPYKSVNYHLEEPLIIHNIGSKNERAQKILEAITKLNLPKELLERFPHQLSVGQRQRVLFGRAIILKPKMLVLDEAFSSLDQENKNEMMSLLKELKSKFGTQFIFISHDLEQLMGICDHFLELKEGEIVARNMSLKT
jgi:peptide/nickel transport system ATP-binding protein